MKRLKQSAKQAFSKTGIYLGLFSAVVTIVGIIGYDTIFVNYMQSIICVIAIFMIAYSVAFFRCFFCNRVVVQLGSNRSVSVGFGDFFSNQGVIIIPFNRYFDTVVNDVVINERSLAGQFIKNYFAGNVSELDQKIELEIKDPNHRNIKKSGKKEAYPIGTIAMVQKGNNDYCCVALTDVNEKFKSVCDIEMLHQAMIAILEFVNNEANGRDVYMPLLGSGFSRLNKGKQDILEYLISIMKVSNIPIQSKLHIVLQESDRESIDLTKTF